MLDLVVIDIGKEKLQLTKEDVKNHLAKGKNITDSELMMFMNLCKYQGLNPWTNDAYLVKYGDNAQIITSKKTFIERANRNPKFKGFLAGVTVIFKNKEGEIEEKNKIGTIVLTNEKLVGAWMKIFIKDEEPYETTVPINEYIRNTAIWKEKPNTMIRKVVIVAGLRECFPELANMYIKEEISQEEGPNAMPVIPNDKKTDKLPDFE